MTQAPGDTPRSDDQTIHLQSVGFFKVTVFEISELTILCQNNDGPDIYWSDDGVLRDLTIDADPPGVCPHHRSNLGGPQIKNSENVKVTGNTITGIADDGILVGSVHDDRRDGTWWLSNEEKPTRNIVISDNIVKVVRPGRTTCGGPITFIPWATAATDPSKVKISGIHVHNNKLFGDHPIRVWDNDRYHGQRRIDGVYNSDNHSPIKEVTFRNNEYSNVDHLGGGGLDEVKCSGSALRLGRITDLKTEFGASSEPEFLNGDFDSNTAYWSVSREAGSIRNDVSMLRDPDARAAAQERLKVWGPFGYTQGDGDNDSAIYQGLGLNDGVEYRFRANVMTSGSPARLFAYNTCTDETVAELSIANTAPREKQFVFRAKDGCDSYQIGIEQGQTGWAFMDSVSLTPTAEVMDSDDPRIRYTAGCWETVQDLGGVIGDSYARAMSRPEGGWASPCPGAAQGEEGPNPVVEATFTGTRASLVGLRRADYGMADVYVDGVYRKTVDLFHGNSAVDGRSPTA